MGRKRMNRSIKYSLQVSLGALCALALITMRVRADEGMWLLDSVGKLPRAEMEKHGLTLTPEQIYSTAVPSLKDAIVLISGGTGSFVSADGLILTNHHVAFDGIRSLSSVESDYLKDGFYAKTCTDERPTSYTARSVVRMKDVTDQVLAAVGDTMSDDDRLRAIRSRELEIEEAAPDSAGLTNSVVDMYAGTRYYLFTFKQLLDVRLVYAPPEPIGNYGGEVDNWTWPRHAGDFTLMRAYVGPDGKPAKYSKDNMPYKPTVFLPISTKGYDEGSFAMILGFPGRTYRYQESAALRLAIDEAIPTTIDVYKTRIDVITEGARNNRAVALQYASKLRRLANTYKKNVAMLEGLRHKGLLALKDSDEALLAAHIASSPDLTKRYGQVLPSLEKVSRELSGVNRKNIILTSLNSGVDILRIANRFINFLSSLPEDSLGATVVPTEKQRGPLREFIRSVFRDFDLNIDKETLVALLLKSAEMPQGQRLTLCDEILGNSAAAGRERRVREFVNNLYEETQLITPSGCERLLLQDPDDINDDEFIRFANKLLSERSVVEATLSGINSKTNTLRQRLAEVWLQWRNTEIHYPDANRTLRFTYGQVLSLSLRDAVHCSYITTLAGVLEKETGKEPFVVPPKLGELWKSRNFGPYADPETHDVPVNFITNLDITGGNSGSPVINGRGEIIGCAFDTNWEGVVSDYRFEERLTRVISVDARYILFLLDKFSDAQNILKELVIR
jgi:hypothetical protein